jgi:hypothetical protein
MEVAGEVVGKQRGDKVKPVAAIEGLEGGWSELSMASSTQTTRWPLWLVTWSCWPVTSLCELQHGMSENLWCSLWRLGMAVLARVAVLNEDKDGAEPMGAWYAEVVQIGMRSRGSTRRPRGARRGKAGVVRRAQARCGMRTEMARVRGGAP